jgi:predicted SnoaL-like aldol condensation-catalyzing enzyme
MTGSKANKIRALLKSIETGDPEAIAVVDEEKYIQHNPQTHAGSEGLATLFKRLSETSPRVNIVRAFEDGNYVFAHTEYDFSNRNIGFEVFLFEGNKAVEHWDNIQRRQGPNKSGRSMVDGPHEASDHQSTEANRTLVHSFVETVLVQGKIKCFKDYVDQDNFIEHNPRHSDDLSGLKIEMAVDANAQRHLDYRQVHRVLAEGNFVLCVSEGYFNAQHSAFYDLFRVNNGKLVEHWDTTERVAPKSEWKNDNGKF